MSQRVWIKRLTVCKSKDVLRGTVVEPATSTKSRLFEHFRRKSRSGVVHSDVAGAWAAVLAGATLGRTGRAGGLGWGWGSNSRSDVGWDSRGG